jgi:hypothetical protein
MVVVEPEQRWLAQDWHREAQLLPVPAWDQCETTTTALYAANE